MQEGENAPTDVLLHYYFKQKPDTEITLRFFNAAGDTIISYSSVKDNKGEPVVIKKEFHQDTLFKRPGFLPAARGLNTFIWDTRYPEAKKIESGNNALISGSLAGPTAVPGMYTVKLFMKDSLLATRKFELKKDPRIVATQEDLQKQFDLLMKISKKQTETSEAINQIRRVSGDIQARTAVLRDSAIANSFKAVTKPLLDSLKKIEEELTQPRAVTDYDLFNFPNKLNDKLAGLRASVGSADAAPLPQAYAVFDDLSAKIDLQIARMKTLLDKKLAEVNRYVYENKLFMIRDKN
jgi:hypothetical protein